MNQLRVAIHGCGGRASGFWAPRLLKRPDVRIVALCDHDPALSRKLLATKFADAAEPPAVYDDPRRMYDQAKPDAAIIITAHTLHPEHCLLALDAGCHVSVEKPMAGSVAQAMQLAERVQRSDKVFQVAFNFPYSERSTGLKQAFARGEYGTLQMISASVSQPWRTKQRGTWRMKPELSGGGFVHDTGTHLIQALLYLHPSPPVEVFARTDAMDCPVEINAAMQIRFQDGVLATLNACGNAPAQCRIGLAFERGYAEFTSLHGHDARVWNHEEKEVALPEFDRTIRHEHNFLNAIQGTEVVRSGWRDGLTVCEILEAMESSARTGQNVALATATFSGA